MMAKAKGIVAGVDVALSVFRRVDPAVRTTPLAQDGSFVEPETLIAEVEGPVASILKAERTALNFLQHLSGVATETGRYVDMVAGHATLILDTRKTIPAFVPWKNTPSGWEAGGTTGAISRTAS